MRVLLTSYPHRHVGLRRWATVLSPRRVLLLVLFFLVALFCATAPPAAAFGNVLLSANFNGDTVNGPPDLTLPGSPTGDFLTLNELAGTVRVRNAVGTLFNKPAEMNQVPGVGGVGLLAFVGPATGCDTIYVSWRSLARSNSIFLMSCVIRGSGIQVIGAVSYAPNGVLTYLGNTLPVTYTPDVAQKFEVIVDLAAQTTSVAVDGVAMVGFQNVPFFQAATSITRLGFEAGGTTSQDYAVDDLQIEEIGTCGTVPVHNRTWGAIKSLYNQ